MVSVEGGRGGVVGIDASPAMAQIAPFLSQKKTPLSFFVPWALPIPASTTIFKPGVGREDKSRDRSRYR